MTNNGKKKRLVLRVELNEGKMEVTLGECNMALLSHAVRLASLELDNLIIGANQPKESPLSLPDRFVQ